MWINPILTFSRTKGVAIVGERSALLFIKKVKNYRKEVRTCTLPNSFHVKNSVKKGYPVLFLQSLCRSH